MGSYFLNTSKVKIIDSTPVGQEFDYFRHKGFVTYTIDPKYNIPLKEINFDGLLETSIQLGPESKAARSRFLLLERTPPPTPSISSFSSIVDSRVYTVF